MSKLHTVSTDDFEDYAPEVLLASHASGHGSKRLMAEVSFTTDIHSGKPVGRVMFVVSRKGDDKPFSTEFLNEAIEHYNSL